VIGSAVYFKAPEYRYLLLEENQLVENVTAFLFMLSAVWGFTLLVRDRRRKIRRLMLWSTTGLGLIGFLDEVSFGEDIFGLTMPMIAGVKVNAVHDLTDVARTLSPELPFVLNYALFLGFATPVMFASSRRRKELSYLLSLVPQHRSYCLLTIFTVLGFLVLLLDQEFIRSTYLVFVEEIMEMNAAFLLVLVCLDVQLHLAHASSVALDSEPPKSRKPDHLVPPE
jgi:hypothetical protein